MDIATDLDIIDPSISGTEVTDARASSGISALLMIAVCVGFAIIAAAAVSVVLVTGTNWFGVAIERLFVFGLFSL